MHALENPAPQDSNISEAESNMAFCFDEEIIWVALIREETKTRSEDAKCETT